MAKYCEFGSASKLPQLCFVHIWEVICMKKVLCLLLIVTIIALGMTGCNFDDDSKIRAKGFDYVMENREHLEEVVAMEIPGPLEGRWEEKDAFMQDNFDKESIVKSIYRHNDLVVEFIISNRGSPVTSRYYGFYYSGDDTPSTLQFTGHPLTETEPGAYEMEIPKEAISYYTVRICENWFYYKLIWI